VRSHGLHGLRRAWACALASTVIILTMAPSAHAHMVNAHSSLRAAICRAAKPACDTDHGTYRIVVQLSTRTARRWALVSHLVARVGAQGTWYDVVHREGRRWKAVFSVGTGTTDRLCSSHTPFAPEFRRDLASVPPCHVRYEATMPVSISPSVPRARPGNVVLSQDGSVLLGGLTGAHPTESSLGDQFGALRWTSWTAHGGSAHGALWRNNCVPSCGNGHYSARPATVRVFDPSRYKVFERLAVTVAGHTTIYHATYTYGTGGGYSWG
jgi:hypothetical protein